MADMTVGIDEQSRRASRIKTVQQGTSVNEIRRQAIEAFARGAGDGEARARRLRTLAETVRSDGGPLGPGREALCGEPGVR